MERNRKTVLVTGACINTGVAIVERFAAEGHRVIFTGRNYENVLKKEQEYRNKIQYSEVFGYAIDALIDEKTVDEKAVEKMFEYFDSKGWVIDSVVLNAADQGLGQKIFENPLTDFMRVINVNVVWNYCICEHAAKRMKENGGGSIVFVNSNTAYRAIPDRTAYVASKGGQLGLMRALALDLGKYNIRVNAVLPGMIRTDRMEKYPERYEKLPSMYTPIGDIAYGADIADAVFYFSEYARNTTGAELVVDGGNTIQLYPLIPKED